MREIKFRGKSALSIEEMESKGIEHEDGWIYGSLIENGKYPVIVSGFLEVNDDYLVHEMFCSVEKESIGQYTGLKDKNGREIYEGDVLEGFGRKGFRMQVVYRAPNFSIKWFDEMVKSVRQLSDGTEPIPHNIHVTSEVIGNIYENPELLEGEE